MGIDYDAVGGFGWEINYGDLAKLWNEHRKEQKQKAKEEEQRSQKRAREEEGQEENDDDDDDDEEEDWGDFRNWISERGASWLPEGLFIERASPGYDCDECEHNYMLLLREAGAVKKIQQIQDDDETIVFGYAVPKTILEFVKNKFGITKAPGVVYSQHIY